MTFSKVNVQVTLTIPVTIELEGLRPSTDPAALLSMAFTRFLHYLEMDAPVTIGQPTLKTIEERETR